MYAVGDCGQAGSAWRGGFPIVWGNVGVADKGEGHPLKKGGQAAHLAKQTSWNRLMDEKQDIVVCHSKNKKQQTTEV
ncbi:MAG: hypothetical protein Q4D37_00505 [Oscillospiraceae bacterium]|nr:hypothetical protein [Oscillospiraceae bacterium]